MTSRLLLPALCSNLVICLPLCEAVSSEVLMRRASPSQASADGTFHGMPSSADITVSGHRAEESVGRRHRGRAGQAAGAKLLEDKVQQEPLKFEAAPFRPELLTDATDEVFKHHAKATKTSAAKKIQWAQHSDKCLCKNATSGSYAFGLVIWDCSDSSKANQMKWTLPSSGDLGVGSIRWAGDDGANQCVASHQGWPGNGNTILLAVCNDTDVSNTGALSWSIFNAIGSDYTTISYSQVSTKCLDVHQGQTVDGTHLEMWDCTAGTQWMLTDWE